MDDKIAPSPVGAPAPAPAAPVAGGQPKPDLLDKVLIFLAKKAGRPEGKDRGTIEKISDKIRQFIEKKTGRKVPAMVSN